GSRISSPSRILLGGVVVASSPRRDGVCQRAVIPPASSNSGGRHEQLLCIIGRAKAIRPVREVALGQSGGRHVLGLSKAGCAGKRQHLGRREEADKWRPAGSCPFLRLLKPRTHLRVRALQR